MKTAIQQLRQALLKLHKTLLDSERVSYEKTVGTIQSPSHFLKLLTGDPWFAWLHQLSQLIVAMDEVLSDEEQLTPVALETLVNQTRNLLVVSETGTGFATHYFEALQRDPDVVLAHAEVVKLFGPRKEPG
jgi:hypothetical protein